jgi:precorrin-2 dehydrogenase/sirohydrochlorin ferrochelatase
VASLLDCGALVTVIAPLAQPELRQRAERGEIEWHARPYRRGDLSDALLAMAATDSGAVNEAVVRDARSLGVLVGAVDGTPGADFASAAVIRRGDLTLAVSTGGTSPAFAAWLRRELETLVDDRLPLLELLAEVRPLIAGRDLDPDWASSLAEPIPTLVARGEREQARTLLAYRLGVGARGGALPR